MWGTSETLSAIVNVAYIDNVMKQIIIHIKKELQDVSRDGDGGGGGVCMHA